MKKKLKKSGKRKQKANWQDMRKAQDPIKRTEVTNIMHHLVACSLLVGALAQKANQNPGYMATEEEKRSARWLYDNGVICPGLVPPEITESIAELFKVTERTEEEVGEVGSE
jgi:hypothetical protein